MKTKSKLLSTLLAVGLAASLAGCGGGASSSAPSSGAPSSSVPESSAPSASEPAGEPVELVVAAAASLTDVAAELADAYKTVAPNVTITYTFGSSGALQTQIEEGAPADVFFSAALKQMTALEEKDLIDASTKKELLENKVVLIVPKDSALGLASFEEVGTDKVKTVALGEPTGVPVGQYSEEIFTTLGILDAVKAKANYGSDVRQVLTWVESGEVDCGVVYATDAATSDDVTVVCTAPEGSCQPVIYPVAVVKASKQAEAAKAYVDFLSTPEAAALFEKYGFSVNG